MWRKRIANIGTGSAKRNMANKKKNGEQRDRKKRSEEKIREKWKKKGRNMRK
jgi:hypothetical protein